METNQDIIYWVAWVASIVTVCLILGPSEVNMWNKLVWCFSLSCHEGVLLGRQVFFSFFFFFFSSSSSSLEYVNRWFAKIRETHFSVLHFITLYCPQILQIFNCVFVVLHIITPWLLHLVSRVFANDSTKMCVSELKTCALQKDCTYVR